MPEVLTHNVTKSNSSPHDNGVNNGNNAGGQNWSNVIHVYQVENKGPSTIDKAFVYIYWPSFNINGQPLLELAGEPIISGNGVCYNIRTPQQVRM